MMAQAPQDTVLEEEIDETYYPTEEELLEYATWLGIDLPKHKNLLWIAKEALTAPLPNQWKPCITEEDEIYYFNFSTGESIWDHPCDVFYRNLYREKAMNLQQHLDNHHEFLQGEFSMNAHAPNTIQEQDQKTPGEVQSTCFSGSTYQLPEMDAQEKMSAFIQNLREQGYRAFSQYSLRSPISAGSKPPNKSFTVSSFPVMPLYSSRSSLATRSLPIPHTYTIERVPLTGDLCSKAAITSGNSIFNPSMFQNSYNINSAGGIEPPVDALKVPEVITFPHPVHKDDLFPGMSTTSTEEDHPKEGVRQEIEARVRQWMQKEEPKINEVRRFQLLSKIQAIIAEEERVVLQQERIEMIERVSEIVQDEEHRILESLRGEMASNIEKQVQRETEALLERRRKEIYEEVEKELQVKKQRVTEELKCVEEKKNNFGEDRGHAQDMDKKLQTHGLEEQLQVIRDGWKEDLMKLLDEERREFESEKKKRLQELREKLQQEESMLMDNEKQEMVKKVKEEIQEEELILFEKMKSDMVARVKQKVKSLEKTTFEKELEQLIQRTRSELKGRELKEIFEKEMKFEIPNKKELLNHKTEQIWKFSNNNVQGCNFETGENKTVTSDNKQGDFQEERIRSIVSLSSPPTDTNTTFMVHDKITEEDLISRIRLAEVREDPKRQVLQFISDFKESSLRQKIRQEILHLISVGGPLGNMNDKMSVRNQSTLQINPNVVQEAGERKIHGDAYKPKPYQQDNERSMKQMQHQM